MAVLELDVVPVLEVELVAVELVLVELDVDIVVVVPCNCKYHKSESADTSKPPNRARSTTPISFRSFPRPWEETVRK